MAFAPLRERGRGSMNSEVSIGLNQNQTSSSYRAGMPDISQPALKETSTCTVKLLAFMYDTRVQLLTMLLVFFDFIAIVIELLVEVQTLRLGGNPQEIARAFQYTSLAITLIFVVEMGIKIGALRHRFLLQRGNVADAFLVLVALVFELVFFENNVGASELCSLIILGRWWRLWALARGHVSQIRRDAESRLRYEFELRMNAENEVLVLRASRDALELERNALKDLLERSGIAVSSELLSSAIRRLETVHSGSANGDLSLLEGVEDETEAVRERRPIASGPATSFGATHSRERFEIEAQNVAAPHWATTEGNRSLMLASDRDLDSP